MLGNRNDSDVYDVAEPFSEILRVFIRQFGKPMELLPVVQTSGYPTVLSNLSWPVHDLTASFSGKQEGPLRVAIRTTNQETQETTKQIRNVYEVNPRAVLRKVLRQFVSDDSLSQLDRQFVFCLVVLNLGAAAWLLLGLPAIGCAILVFASAYVNLAVAYAKRSKAIEVRLVLVKAFWLFSLIGIPGGTLFILAATVATLFPAVFPPSYDLGVITTLIVMILVYAAMCIAFGYGKMPGRKADAQWKILSADQRDGASFRVPASVDIAARVLYSFDVSFLLSMLIASITSLLLVFHGEIVQQMGISYYVLLFFQVSFLVLLFYFMYRQIGMTNYRRFLLLVPGELPDYPMIVKDIAKEESRRNRYRERIRFG